MTNPAIVFTAPCVAEILEKPMPSPAPGKVLLRTVRTCVSSGTERANLVGDPVIGPTIPDGAPAVFPRHLGYSASGLVEAVGEGGGVLDEVEAVVAGDALEVAFIEAFADHFGGELDRGDLDVAVADLGQPVEGAGEFVFGLAVVAEVVEGDGDFHIGFFHDAQSLSWLFSEFRRAGQPRCFMSSIFVRRTRSVTRTTSIA